MGKVSVQDREQRVCNGDIFRDIEYVENISTIGLDKYKISVIRFPLIIVLSQDCDLKWDNELRTLKEKAGEGVKLPNDDKRLLSVLVAPLYNMKHATEGTQLSGLDMQMSPLPPLINSKGKVSGTGKAIVDNQNPRYHYLEFEDEVQIVESVIDFKHYFTLGTSYLADNRPAKFVCSIADLYREKISQRFAYFLSRVGLPDGND